ncbi:unnamed protein product [Parnassius apollo]|uniref:(apollo) hypothetical protein n=1 Tax=Parnassius apollo TaxID=110799 RepID=A0A8S3X9C9_PARAO|nr:unnamed protein product [Parnassius apollo]
MSRILRWQESKSERRACGGGGRPTVPPVAAERSITHMPPRHLTTLSARESNMHVKRECLQHNEHRGTCCSGRSLRGTNTNRVRCFHRCPHPHPTPLTRLTN